MQLKYTKRVVAAVIFIHIDLDIDFILFQVSKCDLQQFEIIWTLSVFYIRTNGALK